MKRFWAAVAAAALAGCVSPGKIDPTILVRYQQAMAERGPQERAAQEGLESLQPVGRSAGPKLHKVPDPKTGKVSVYVGLNEAILMALANSLDIRVVSYQPAISREEMTMAAAEFDYVVFGAVNRARTDEQSIGTSSIIDSERDERLFEAGLRQKTVTGAEWAVTWDMTRTWDNATFSDLRTRWEPVLRFELTQPLLRDAWPEFNLAKLRIARLNHRIGLAQFRQKAEETITAVIETYWRLVQARRELEIQQSLLDKTVDTYERVLARREMDATDVEVKQSLAAVESRRASVIRAKKNIRDTEDALARLLNDPQVNLARAAELVPTSALSREKVAVDVTDQLLAALRHNPLLEEARLAIATADVNVRVAQNQTLPRLDFAAASAMQGLNPALHEGSENLFTGDYVSYTFGLEAEYPIGNRERLANLRARRLERLRATTELQNLADQVAQLVRERVRQIDTTVMEMEAQAAAVRASRAETEALKVLLQTRAMQPELLQLELQSIQNLGNAERAELAAIADYNVAIAQLAQATGTVFELHGVKLALPAVEGGFDEPLPVAPLEPTTRPQPDRPAAEPRP